MKVSEATYQQIKRALSKVVTKFSAQEDDAIVTDIHIQVKQDSGDLIVFNDDEEELTRCVVEEWIGSTEDDFYSVVADALRYTMGKMKETLDKLSILKPYSFVLVDDDKETITELYLVDDDTVIVGDELLKGLDKELDDFITKLLKE